MAENRHTMSDLYQMQALPLSAKIRMTVRRINEAVNLYGEEGLYVSFSGGKDSTVLLHIVREVCGYKKIPAVFVDVPTQYPELKEFAIQFDNVVVVKPKISFSEVCEKYGFPLISKEVSECVEGARKYLIQIKEQINSDCPGNDTDIFTKKSQELASILNHRYQNKLGGNNLRLARLLGMFTTDNQIAANIPSEKKSNFSQEKYKFMLDADFEISNKCCNVMKKEPAHRYEKETGRIPIIGTMASESKLRTQKWLQQGCNSFDGKHKSSKPMSFWTDQDVLLYIKQNNLEICSVYGDIVEDYEATGDVEGQLTISDLKGFEDCGIFDAERPPLKTTGCERTGCVLCGFGCHLNNDMRFVNLRETHPRFHNLLFVLKNNGITYAEAIDWLNEHGNLNIKY